MYSLDGLASFVCEAEGSTVDDPMFHPDYCPSCSIPFCLDTKQPTKVIEHLSTHVLFDIKLQNSQPCCFCLQPSPMCSIYLKNGQGQKGAMSIDKTHSHGCQNLLLSFNYQKAAQSTHTSPCSNVPITCPHCSSSQPAVWWYNLESHFKTHHASDDVSQYSKLYILTQKERDVMHLLWNTWAKIADGQCQRHKKATKLVRTSKVLSTKQVLHVYVTLYYHIALSRLITECYTVSQV